MKKLISYHVTLIMLLLSTPLLAQDSNNPDDLLDSDPLKKEFSETMRANGLKSKSSHSYCVENEELYGGHGISTTKRIASVTKLYTTLLAIDSLDLHQRFKTYFYYNKKNLHIVGGKDPWFEAEKLFYLIQELNKKGITELKTITFDDSFYANTRPSSQYQPHKNQYTSETLAQYFNTRRWSQRTKYFYNKTIEFAEKEGYTIKLGKLKMKAQTIGFSQINPLKNFKDTATYIHTSRPFHAILKGMNSKSKNFVSEFIWNRIEDKDLKLKDMNLKDSTVSLNNGSGLPIKSSKSRKDNTASCAQVLAMLKELKEKIKIANFDLDDLIMHGSDVGTFEKRMKKDDTQAEVKNQVFAKTGTVRNTSALAGFMYTDNSDTPMNFVVLNHTTSSRVGRKFQDELITKAYQKFKAKDNTPYQYKDRSIFPLDAEFFD
ncbi:D-alanyl-D-alanine carboxypeptidase [Bacteriovoracaceae bacterium]|nr:D-alanyl-D-alanine carboxypeptidase [Bacteriovoracaceae bacterium]